MARDDNYDEFSGGTGLVDDYDGTITDAFFSTDANYNNGQTLCLHLEVATDDTSNPEVVNLYPCGPDWASYDDGETAEHPKGEKQRFNGNTKVMKLIAAAIATGPEAEAEMRRRSRELFNGLGHRYAALWKGMKFHWNVQTEDVKFTDKMGKLVERQTNVVVPTAWLGVDESIPPMARSGGSAAGNTATSSTSSSSTANAPSTQPAAATSSAAPEAATTTTGASGNGASQAPQAPDDVLSTLDAEASAKLRLAAKTQDYPTFVDSALEIPGIPTNAAVVSKLGDENFYLSLRA